MAKKTENSKVGKKAAKVAKKAAKKAEKSETKVDKSNTHPIRHFLPKALMTRQCRVRSMTTRALCWLAYLVLWVSPRPLETATP